MELDADAYALWVLKHMGISIIDYFDEYSKERQEKILEIWGEYTESDTSIRT